MRATPQVFNQALIASPLNRTENYFSMFFMDIKFFSGEKAALFPDLSRENNLALRAQSRLHGKKVSYLFNGVNSRFHVIVRGLAAPPKQPATRWS